MQFYKFKTIPQKYSQRAEELEKLINQYNPAKILINKFFFQRLKFYPSIFVMHKPIKKVAKFDKNKIYLDFRNSPKYLWLCICHETAHILLRLYGWEKSKIYKILKEDYQKDMIYSIDQSCAILLQAYCENLLKIRPLYWKDWQSTFSYMEVDKTGRIFWPEFLKYIKKRKKLFIFKWLEEMEEKGLLKRFYKR